MSPKKITDSNSGGAAFRHPRSRASKRSKIETGRQKRLESHKTEHLKKLRPTLLKLRYFQKLILEHPERKKWTKEQIVEAATSFVKNYKKHVPCGYKPGTFAYHEHEEAVARVRASFDAGIFEVPDLTDLNTVKRLAGWKQKEEGENVVEESMDTTMEGAPKGEEQWKEEGILGGLKRMKVGRVMKKK